MTFTQSLSHRLLAFLIALSFLCFPFQAQAQSPPSDLYVAIVYDGNNDGVNEGAGANIPVYIRESGSTQEFVAPTNDASVAHFTTGTGTYIVEAFFQRFPFFVWVCRDTVLVDEPEEFDTIECKVKFFVWAPLIAD